MAETLLLSHTIGRAGWDVAHAGGRSEFALAAVGHCFLQRRLLFNLTLVWRLRRLWRDGVARLDPRALRIALCVDDRVRVGGACFDVRLVAPVDDGPRPKALLEASLPLVLARGRDARLPAAGDGMGWRVYALGADAVQGFRPLARALEGAARGTRTELRASLRSSRAPSALRAAYPLRIDLLFDADAGYVTLVPARTLALEHG